MAGPQKLHVKCLKFFGFGYTAEFCVVIYSFLVDNTNSILASKTYLEKIEPRSLHIRYTKMGVHLNERRRK